MAAPEPRPHNNQRQGLRGARIVLGISGGIAAYKAAELVSTLVQQGADVSVLLTEGATAFIQPLTFEALTRRPVFSGVFEGWHDGEAGHVTLAREADVLLVAPATANTMARLAMGMTDDMLGAVALSTTAPIVIAPAMEHHMWHHAATKANLATLRERGVTVVGPEHGYLASGAQGDGRLAALPLLMSTVRQVLGQEGPLAGERVLITAGGTREPVDPVRYLGNRSSGQMGLALADAAMEAGADVTLIAGPTIDMPPVAYPVVRVETAQDMERAVTAESASTDVLIMAAAVADYRPATASEQKLKRQALGEDTVIALTENTDILAGVSRSGLLKVGFAAETEHLLEHAQRKLERKGVDLLIANDAVATLGQAESEATMLRPDREPRSLPRMAKSALAYEVIEEIVRIRTENDDA